MDHRGNSRKLSSAHGGFAGALDKIEDHTNHKDVLMYNLVAPAPQAPPPTEHVRTYPSFNYGWPKFEARALL